MVNLGTQAVESLVGKYFRYPSEKYEIYYGVRGPSYFIHFEKKGMRTELAVNCDVWQHSDGFNPHWFRFNRSYPIEEIFLYEEVKKEDLPWIKSRREKESPLAIAA